MIILHLKAASASVRNAANDAGNQNADYAKASESVEGGMENPPHVSTFGFSL